jgi:vacuolar-type H+-ATPase subunit F/Vma7
MGPVVVIGDELSCAGFRLAGADVHLPPATEVPALFDQALVAARLVVLTGTAAAALAPATLRAALAREAPLLVVLPDLRDPDAAPDYARRIRAVLGIET